MKKMRPKPFLSLFTMLSATAAFAGGDISIGQPGTAPSVQADLLNHLNNSLVINFIHHINNKEIREGQEAGDRLQSVQARQFANHLVNAHQENEQKLLQLAAQKNITVGNFELATYEFTTQNQLRTLHGVSFDQGFLQIQKQGHQQVLQSLQLMLPSISDPNIVAFINKMIPTIQQHINQAASIHVTG